MKFCQAQNLLWVGSAFDLVTNPLPLVLRLTFIIK